MSLTNRFFGERFTAVHCVICAKPVRRGQCKVTDLGEPSHESCLVDQLLEEIKKHKAALAAIAFAGRSTSHATVD
jgi:hypothetical protein